MTPQEECVSEKMIGAGLEVYFLMMGRPARSIVEQIYRAMATAKLQHDAGKSETGA